LRKRGVGNKNTDCSLKRNGMKSIVGLNILLKNPSGFLLRRLGFKFISINCHKNLTLKPYETIGVDQHIMYQFASQ
jgi:hypothetical protein